MNLLKIIWLLSSCLLFSLQSHDHPFVFVVCSYNNAQWYKKNLDSLFAQNYENYRVIYIDDNSEDRTGQLVANYLVEKNLRDKTILICNQTRRYKLYNLYHAIHELCQDHEIVVEVDGDDWLLSGNVLTILNEIYQNDIWMTYGGFTCWPKTFNYLKTQDIPESVLEQKELRVFFRKGFIFLALRSFYAGLFKQIKKEDLLYDGDFFKRSSDVATMLPMFEMAGKRFYHIKEPVYLYNTETGFNDYMVDFKHQSLLCNIIQGKAPYAELQEPPF